MINQCIQLFDLTPVSENWSVAGDWLEDHGNPLAHHFRARKYSLFDPDSLDGFGYSLGSGCGYGCGSGDGSGDGCGTGYGYGSADGPGGGWGAGYGYGSSPGAGDGTGGGLGAI